MHTVTKTGAVRVHQGPDGYHVIGDVTPDPFGGAFLVAAASASTVVVGPGTVDDRIPLLNGVSLDGKNAAGDTVNVPPLDLSSGPNTDFRSWVFLQCTVDLSTGVMDPKKRDAAIIVHGNDLSSYLRNGFSLDDGKGNGRYPLAMIVWQDKQTPQQIIQFVRFPQKHHFKPAATAKAKGAHWFSPIV